MNALEEDMTTVEEWRTFLQKWSDEWLSTDEDFPNAVRKSRWLGYKPATEEQIAQLEERLGYRLPPSYRSFLATTNGWRRTSSFVERVRAAKDVKWLEDDDPQLVDIWCGSLGESASDPFPQKAYYSYDGRDARQLPSLSAFVEDCGPRRRGFDDLRLESRGRRRGR